MSPEEISNHHRIFFDEHQAVNPREKMEKLKEIFSQYEAPEEGKMHNSELKILNL